MFPQMRLEVCNPFVCTWASFAFVPSILVVLLTCRLRLEGWRYVFIAFRPDVLHSHDFKIVPCVVNVTVSSWVKDGRTLWYRVGTCFLFIIRNGDVCVVVLFTVRSSLELISCCLLMCPDRPNEGV